jgi:hypothetical protein
MCTVSWLVDGDRYALCHSRDEHSARMRARPPRRVEVAGRAWLAPADSDHSGTWVAANDAGVTLALVNAPLDRGAGEVGEFTSRGRLVVDLAGSPSLAACARTLTRRDLRPFRGFCLAAFAPSRTPRVWRWDGAALIEQPAPCSPLISIPLEDDGIEPSRRRAFEARGEGLSGLVSIHRGHRPSRGRRSVCMHDARVRTVSLSVVEVEPEQVRFRYADGAPCAAALGAALRLDRGA